MTDPSILIQVHDSGEEARYCGGCGEYYLLPIPYDKCNPAIRDLCAECISVIQRNHETSESKSG